MCERTKGTTEAAVRASYPDETANIRLANSLSLDIGLKTLSHTLSTPILSYDGRLLVGLFGLFRLFHGDQVSVNLRHNQTLSGTAGPADGQA